MTKLNDVIELEKLRCSRFSIIGISHLGIEDSYRPSETLKAFLRTGRANVAAVLGKEDIRLDKKLIAQLDEPKGLDLMTFSSCLDDIRWKRRGIVLHFTIPTCTPEGQGMITDHSKPLFAFAYGDDYETALYKAKGVSDEVVAAQLAYRRAFFVDKSNVVMAHGEGRSILSKMKQYLTGSRV
ncbi:MAG: hypothetical protein GY833_22380 [Aestuariibacter sp.]|nr:hypothetical protein [Aestuariibacter sp.]